MGGGVMRTVAKAAALGGYRTSALTEGVFRGSRPFPTTVPAAAGAAVDGAVQVPLKSSATTVEATIAQHQPVWVGHDDWEFAGGVEEELYGAKYPPSRIVFGPVPTLEEAREATSDLKDAVEKVYFSPTTAIQESTVASQASLKAQSDSFSNSSTMMSATGQSSSLYPSGSRHAIQAFSLLKESSEAQSIVASLASDKNVWDAVLKNEKVVEFCKSHQSDFFSKEGSASSDAESVADNEVEKILDCFMEKHEENPTENGFMQFMNSVKQKVSDLVGSLSDLINNIFGSPTAKTTTVDGPGSSNSGDTAVVAGGSFLALTIAAILVVLVKRA